MLKNFSNKNITGLLKSALLFCFLIFLNNKSFSVTQAEIDAIKDLYYDTCVSGCTWTYDPNQSPCGQQGVDCVGDNVIKLRLANLGLTGQPPATLGNLLYLQNLVLSSNNFSSATIPSNWMNLSNLVQLELVGCGFIGSIPTNIGDLSNLVTLNLQWNSLTGTLPSSIGSLQNLTSINLWGSSLNGSIPSTIGLASKLRVINFQGNQFTGGIPTEIGDLTKLEDLNLTGNPIGGALPSSISNLTALYRLGLTNTGLEEFNVDAISALQALRYLYLGENNAGGTLSSGFSNLTYIRELDLSGNSFTGIFPTEFNQFLAIETLDLSDNQLEGQIPNFLEQMGLGSLRLKGNNWTCPIVDYSTYADYTDYDLSFGECQTKFVKEVIDEIYLNNCNEDCIWVYDENKSLCEQPEFKCNFANHVYDINLRYLGLNGELPNPSFQIEILSYIGLDGNEWTCPLTDYSSWADSTDYFDTNERLCSQEQNQNTDSSASGSGGSFTLFYLLFTLLTMSAKYILTEKNLALPK